MQGSFGFGNKTTHTPMKKKNLLLVTLLVVLGAANANATTYNVDDLSDPTPLYGSQTFRGALTNATISGDTIRFLLSGTITPTTVLPTINNNIVFDTNGYTITVHNSNLTGSYLLNIGDSNPSITIPNNFNLIAEGGNNVKTIYGNRSVTIQNSLDGSIQAIATTGDNAFGILANGYRSGSNYYAGNITITGDLAGSVSAEATNGNYAYGLRAGGSTRYGSFVQFNVGGDINILGDLSGDVSADANSYAYGLYAQGGRGTATGSINIGNLSGNVTVDAKTGSDAYGIYANGTSWYLNGSFSTKPGNITIGDLSGEVNVSAAGDNAFGLKAGNASLLYFAPGGITISDLSGKIKVDAGGSNAYGMQAVSNIGITNDLSGRIITKTGADEANGIAAGGSVSVGNDLSGRIITIAGGNDAEGITALGSVSVGNDLSGRIVTIAAGNDATGISALGNVSVGNNLSGRIITKTGGNNATGISSFLGSIEIDGALSGKVITIADGSNATALNAGGGIHGLSDGALLISGIVLAKANGSATGIYAYGPMNLDITGKVLGIDTSGGGNGYAIRSGSPFIPANDAVTVEDYGKLVGSVDLGNGNDTMIVKDYADIDNVPLLSGGTGGESARSDSGVTIPANMTSGDLLEFNGWTGTLGAQVSEWENIWVTNSSSVDLGDGISNLMDISSVSGPIQFTVDAGSSVYAGGHSPLNTTIGGNYTNNGILSMLDNEVDDTFTITGNYDGAGSLLLDANLGTSGITSPELVTVNGTAGVPAGTTSVVVNNVITPVAVTEGQGIKVIDTNNLSSVPTAFVLDNPDDFGPFAVNLVEGSDYDWYVVSPGYREEAAVLQAVTPFVEKLGYESIPRFHERRAYTWFADKKAEQEAFWVRTYGSKYRLGLTGDAATSIHGYDGGFQLGTDILAGGDKNSRHNIGLYAGIGYIDGEVDGLRSDNAGKLIDTAYNFGTYLTLHGPNSYYIEAVGQASYHNLSIDYRTEPKQDVKFWSYLASIETGVGIPFSPCFTLQPQAQLIYQQTEGFGINTGVLTGNVDIAQHEGLQGRLGITGMFKSCDFDYNPFFEVNLIKDFSDPSRVTYRLDQSLYHSLYPKDPITLSSTPETLFLGGAIGISRKVSEKNNLSYFLKAEAMYGLEGRGSYDYKLTAGIRKTW
jgi:hypothetical protein